MLKTSTCLVATMALGLGSLPKTAFAQTASECRQGERAVMLDIQSKSPAIGSRNYEYFWTVHVPTYLAGLQEEYPNCNFYRTRTITDQDVRDRAEQMQEDTDLFIETVYD